MKRFFALLLLMAILGGGYWMMQRRARVPVSPTSGNLTRLARDIKDSVQAQKDVLMSPPSPTAPQLSKYETMLCNLANEERKKRGLPQLQIVPALAAVARGHSREMMQKGYFAHESPTPNLRDPMDRYVSSYKWHPRLIAENIFKLQGPPSYRLAETEFRQAHEGWMNSPHHRDNILRTAPAGGPTQIGVGIVVKGGSYWATQLFARPLP